MFKTLHHADGVQFSMPTTEFDRLVDEGYETIVVVTPTTRYTATVDEWQDYGYFDSVSGADEGGPEVEVIVMHRSYMVRG